MAVNGQRIPKIGDAVTTTGELGHFWISVVSDHSQTVELRLMDGEHLTSAGIPWSDLQFLENPGEYDHVRYDTTRLREQAAAYYGSYMTESRIGRPGIANGHARKATESLIAYDCLIAILKGRGEWPAGR